MIAARPEAAAIDALPIRYDRPGGDARQVEILSSRGFLAGTDLPQHAKTRPLKDRLLAVGGWAVCLPGAEPDLENILSRGTLLDGHGAALLEGEQSRCHENSARLWSAAPDPFVLMTGYAMSADGIWRQHSWCWDAKTARIAETTRERVAYFGFALDRAESLAFATSNPA